MFKKKKLPDFEDGQITVHYVFKTLKKIAKESSREKKITLTAKLLKRAADDEEKARLQKANTLFDEIAKDLHLTDAQVKEYKEKLGIAEIVHR